MSKKAATRWVVVLTGIGSLMAALDTLVVSTALSTIRVDLGASVEALEWTVNAYNLSFAVLLMTASSLGDRFGRRRLFAFGLALFTLASVASALAPGAGALIAARTVQGMGAAFVMPLALTLVGNLFEGIEIELLAGVPEEDAPHAEVLDAIGALIERAESNR